MHCLLSNKHTSRKNLKLNLNLKLRREIIFKNKKKQIQFLVCKQKQRIKINDNPQFEIQREFLSFLVPIFLFIFDQYNRVGKKRKIYRK